MSCLMALIPDSQLPVGTEFLLISLVNRSKKNKNAFCGTRYLSYCCRLYCYGDIKAQMYRPMIIYFSKSRDVIGHLTILFAIYDFPYILHRHRHSLSNAFKGVRHRWLTTMLTFLNHVTSSVTCHSNHNTQFHFTALIFQGHVTSLVTGHVTFRRALCYFL